MSGTITSSKSSSSKPIHLALIFNQNCGREGCHHYRKRTPLQASGGFTGDSTYVESFSDRRFRSHCHTEVSRKVRAIVQLPGQTEPARFPLHDADTKKWYIKHNLVIVPSNHPIRANAKLKNNLGRVEITGQYTISSHSTAF